MFNNIPLRRLIKFYSKIYDIEARAFDNDKKLFLRCHNFNCRLYEEIKGRQ